MPRPAPPPDRASCTLWPWVLAAAALWWAGIVVELFAVGGVLCAAAAVVLSIRAHRWQPLLVTLALVPPTVIAVAATVDYLRGEARLLVARKPHITLHNVDRETRTPRESRPNSTWVRRAPHNAALRALTAIFGPTPGAYDGPYPTPSEARAALEGGMPWPQDRHWPDAAPRLPMGLESLLDEMARDDAEVRMALWRERVGLFEATRTRPGVGPGPGATARASILVDQASGMVLAYRGDVSLFERGLLVPWRRSTRRLTRDGRLTPPG